LEFQNKHCRLIDQNNRAETDNVDSSAEKFSLKHALSIDP
jgi:hypothetical protein